MRAVVDARDVVPRQRMIEGDLDTRARASRRGARRSIFCEPSQSSSTCTFTPALARSDSASANCLADVARPVDVRLEVDRAPRAANRLQHRREDLVAVLQRLRRGCRTTTGGPSSTPSERK